MTLDTTETLSYSVEQFCKAHNISRAFFYNLRKKGKAPRIMRVGCRILISAEAAAEWRERMTALSNQSV